MRRAIAIGITLLCVEVLPSCSPNLGALAIRGGRQIEAVFFACRPEDRLTRVTLLPFRGVDLGDSDDVTVASQTPVRNSEARNQHLWRATLHTNGHALDDARFAVLIEGPIVDQFVDFRPNDLDRQRWLTIDGSMSFRRFLESSAEKCGLSVAFGPMTGPLVAAVLLGIAALWWAALRPRRSPMKLRDQTQMPRRPDL